MTLEELKAYVAFMRQHSVGELRIPGKIELVLEDHEPQEESNDSYLNLEGVFQDSTLDPREEPDLYPDGKVPELPKKKGN